MKNSSPNRIADRIRLPLAIAALALPLATAHAAVATYTDRAAFTAALGGATSFTETFSTNRTFVVGDNLYNGIDFRVTGGSVGGNGISGGVLNGDEFTYSVDYLFTSPIFALGADFTGARTASGLNWTIGGITTPVFSASPGTGFFGVISTISFTLVDVTSGPPPNEIYSLDNLTYATAAAVPEPSTWTLFALAGVVAVGLAQRRKSSGGSLAA